MKYPQYALTAPLTVILQTQSRPARMENARNEEMHEKKLRQQETNITHWFRCSSNKNTKMTKKYKFYDILGQILQFHDILWQIAQF